MIDYKLQNLLHKFIQDPENSDNNLTLAIYYHNMGHTASAVSYYLRTAERTQNDKVKYECLLGAAKCFEEQGSRSFTVKSLLQNALTVLANRPEAYYLLSKFYRKEGNHYDAYLLASIGEQVAEKNPEPLDFDIGYSGFYSIVMEKAEVAYPCGLCDESRSLFFKIKDEYISDMTEEDKNYLQDKLSALGPNGPSYQYKTYETKDYFKLRYKFKNSKYIKNNHSQIFQDIFILSILDGKREGTFLEIGGGLAYHKSNTALLESNFGWKGVSIEFNEICVNNYRKYRPNINVLHADALSLDYSKLIKEYCDSEQVIDYLQLDIEPSANTYETLLLIPFNEYKFRVITYEHDHCVDVTSSYRDKSREHLIKMGYELVVSNVAEDHVSPVEDWWVHPDLVDRKIIDKMKSVSDETQNAEDYMLCNTFDWGITAENQWFKEAVERKILTDNGHQKFFKVEDGDIVFDVGASVGQFTYFIKDQNPGKVYCLEPDNKLYSTLVKNVESTDVICVPKIITFKSFIEQNKIEKIDFLKLDCETEDYHIFNDENFEWIKRNVKKIAGEFHLITPEQKAQFRKFRDTYLRALPNHEVFSLDNVNIKHDLWSDWFIEYYAVVTLYIDNRFSNKNRWKNSIAPTMEFTTSIDTQNGCVVDCVFCPQRTLQKSYKGERFMTLNNFQKAVDKLPQEVRVTFAGFTEPWLNKECTDMVLYAHEKGHPISIFTTGIGMSIEDIERIKHIPFAGNPNGCFTLHLPDQERKAKHPITKRYIELIEHIGKIQHEIHNFTTMCMGNVHEDVSHVFSGAPVYDMWSRAGNLVGEMIMKPELLERKEEWKMVNHGEKQMTCGCLEKMYHNVMLPNGDVSLCCMDYGLKHILGNLYEEDYEEIIPQNNQCFELCRLCENAVEP